MHTHTHTHTRTRTRTHTHTHTHNDKVIKNTKDIGLKLSYIT